MVSTCKISHPSHGLQWSAVGKNERRNLGLESINNHKLHLHTNKVSANKELNYVFMPSNTFCQTNLLFSIRIVT